MNSKFSLFGFFLFTAILFSSSWIFKEHSRVVSANNRIIYLPLISQPLCIFATSNASFILENEPNNDFSQPNGPIPSLTPVLGCFSRLDDVHDVFYFDLPIESTIKINLTNVPKGHNYDLALYRDAKIAESQNPDNKDEIIYINALMRPGRYFIQVYDYSQTISSHPYQLIVAYDDSRPCDGSAITAEISPQLKDELGQFAFYSKILPFQCRPVDDIVHSGNLALRMEYQADKLDGYWGMATSNGYDASRWGDICLWAYAEQPNQSFTINLKDKFGREIESSVQTVDEIETWQQFCVALSKYAVQGVQLDQLENVNVHFSNGTGSATIWVDNLHFGPSCKALAVLEDIFPQLANEPGAFPFYSGKVTSFHCRVETENVYSSDYAIHMEYGAGGEDGYWGIASPFGYDASQSTEICLRIYPLYTPQSFSINLKDLEGNEASVTRSLAGTKEWKNLCIPLAQYGIKLSQLENVNIHFGQGTGDANLIADDIEFQ